ncbi:MAG: anthranilate phosphoribosyltransferase [Myxococcales bacterium FL481]|nr:MAG: anthranilate phosphoribosyltransferase [Myxococcales bacterium FL481]
MTSANTTAAISSLETGRDLDQPQAYDLFREIIAGDVPPEALERVLVGLRDKGETPDEIAGAASAMRDAATPFPRPDYPFADTCGTGGDGAGSVNVSTAVAFVAAAAGVPVAKHGNRSVSSRCGSADVLEQLGANLAPAPEVSRSALDDVGVCFLFAPQYHPGARHAAPVRKKIGTRTIFNVLGPLVNPARPTIQVMGVYASDLVPVAARTLARMGCRSALTVYGDGLDEIALHGPTTAMRVAGDELDEMTLEPAALGVQPAPTSALAGGGPQENAAWMRTLLGGGGSSAHRDAVAINAAPILWLAGRAPSLLDAVDLAQQTLASGEPQRRLDGFVERSHG